MLKVNLVHFTCHLPRNSFINAIDRGNIIKGIHYKTMNQTE